ncbi:MAG: VCBS repeat-containing protein [Minicystis sp.]
MDLDGDDRVDVLASGPGPSFAVFLNRGDGTYPPRSADYPPPADMTGWFFVDWNQDGRPDIFITGPSHTVLLNDGHGRFEERLSLSPPAASRPPDYMTVADMNGDGRADLVEGFEGGSRDTVEVWLNDGHDVFTSPVRATVTRYGESVRAADLDGDGHLDLIVQSQPRATQSFVSVLLNGMCSP